MDKGFVFQEIGMLLEWAAKVCDKQRPAFLNIYCHTFLLPFCQKFWSPNYLQHLGGLVKEEIQYFSQRMLTDAVNQG